jgi:DNA-binding MarR family transcriptional regulator
VSRADAVADRLHSAAIHLLRALRRQDEATGLSGARLSALSVVVFGGPVTVTKIASAEQVSVPTVTRMLAGMERDGLVKRERDAADRRMIWVRPTAKGTRLLVEGRRRRVAALASDLAKLDGADLDALDRAVTIVERVVGGGPAPWPRLRAPAPRRASARQAPD